MGFVCRWQAMVRTPFLSLAVFPFEVMHKVVEVADLGKVYVMTDLEGVAGVLNHKDWCSPESRYYDVAKRLLTSEVNAAVEGFLAAGAEEILVADGHGPGGISPELLDERAQLERGWPSGPWPLGLDESFDVCAWIGQHAKSRSLQAHLAHTQSFRYFELRVNDVAIGEFGQLAMCASELGVRSIFGSGDQAFAKEAQELVPGIQTVAVKRGLQSQPGDDLSREEYGVWNISAVHFHPARARSLIREGAERALERARTEEFGLIDMNPPYRRTTIFRPDGDLPWRIAREIHETSFIGLMNTPYEPAPTEQPGEAPQGV